MIYLLIDNHINIHLQNLIYHYHHILFLFHFFLRLNIHLQILIYHCNHILFLFHFFSIKYSPSNLNLPYLLYSLRLPFPSFISQIIMSCSSNNFPFHFFPFKYSTSNFNSFGSYYSFPFPFFSPFIYTPSNTKER